MIITAMMMLGGLLWMATYVLVIRRGLLERTYGVPMAAICANLSWEFIFAFVYPQIPPYRYVNMAWLALDLVIFYQLLRYWRSELPHLSSLVFYFLLAAGLATAFSLVILISVEFGDTYHGGYAAYGQNLMMSILFIAMLIQRDSVRGQSMYIALAKLFGTAITSLTMYLFVHTAPGPLAGSPLMSFFYCAILAFDAIYAVMLYRKCKEQGIAPWSRI
jgi:hypothetical protein